MIRSTFSGFNTAQMAMSASQRALDVTGQNLSNVNTPGYTRQRLDLASISPVGASFSSSPYDFKVGQGVEMTGISQIRDPFLDKQYRNQIVKVGTADAMDQVLADIGNIFDETDKKAVAANIDALITQLKNLGTNSGANQSSSDSMVRSAAEILMNAIHQNATDLGAIEGDIVDKLKDSLVPKIDQCIKKIADLNDSIKSSQILGNPALELKDERNAIIDDLATYLPIKVTYTNKNIGSGKMVEVMDITFTTTDPGAKEYSLVSDTKGAKVDLTTTNGGVPLSLIITDAKTGTSDNVDVSNKISDGVLKGNFDMLNKSEKFDVPATDVKGVGFYTKMFDTFVDKFATLMNDLNAGPELDAAGDKVRHDLFSTSDGTGKFTAANVKVSDGWMNGSVSVTRTQNAAGGTTEYENIQKMIDELQNKNTQFVYDDGKGTTVPAFTGNFGQCYINIQNTQAIERDATTSILKNRVTVLNQIANSKDAISGVSMDEEVMNLMRYQQSYNAAARLMTTLDQALETLITGTGVVGR